MMRNLSVCVTVMVMLFFAENLRAQLTLVAKPPVHADQKWATVYTQKNPHGLKENNFKEAYSWEQSSTLEKELGFVLFSRPITQPVYRSSVPKASERSSVVWGFGTQGEYEPMTFSVYPLRKMNKFRVEVSALTSEKGVIARENLDLRLVTYWKLRYPRYTSSKYYRLQPELLESVTINAFDKFQCQRYWLKVKVPSEAAAGVYSGQFTVYDESGEKAVVLPIKFRVFPYALKNDPRRQYSTYFYPSEGKRASQLEAEIEGMKAYGIDALPTVYLAARQSKDGSDEFYIRGRQDVIEKFMAAGFNGPIPFVSVRTVPYFIKRYAPHIKIGRHQHLSEMPPQKFYDAIEQARENSKPWPIKKDGQNSIFALWMKLTLPPPLLLLKFM